MGYSPWGREELDMIEQLNHHHHLLTKSTHEGGKVRPAVSLGPLLVLSVSLSVFLSFMSSYKGTGPIMGALLSCPRDLP